MLCPFRFIQYDSAMMQPGILEPLSKRRRRAINDNEIEMEGIASNRASADPPTTPQSIDLTYPYWWPSPSVHGSGGGGHTCVVDPNGPITLSSTGLNLRTAPPVALDGSKAVSLMTDNTLETVGSNLGVRLSPPLFMSGTGVTVDLGYGLTLTGPQVSVQCVPNRCLTTTIDGIELTTDVTLNNSTNLGVNLRTNGGLKVGPRGIEVKVDGNTVVINEMGELQCIARPINPFTIMEIGDPSVHHWYCYYAAPSNSLVVGYTYMYLVSTAGLVNGYMNLKITRTLNEGNISGSQIKFCIVLPSDFNNSSINVSGLPPPGITPSSANASYFAPNASMTAGGFKGIVDPSTNKDTKTSNWYIPLDTLGFTIHNFVPVPGVISCSTSTMAYGPVNIQFTQTSTNVDVMVFTFVIETDGSWNTNERNYITTGPITFSYQGSVPQ